MSGPAHFEKHRQAYKTLIEQHFGIVSTKAVRQLIRGVRNPTNRLWEKYLFPNLLLDSGGARDPKPNIAHSPEEMTARPIYLPVAPVYNTRGRNHYGAVGAVQNGIMRAQGALSFFANALRIGLQDRDGHWEAPKYRVVGGPFTIFTLEYDAPSQWPTEERIAFLETQLGWFRKSGSNDLDRPIRPVWDWVSQFSDFRGISACYGGHKSVHVHLVFDTTQLFEMRSDLRDSLRPGYSRLFEHLREEIDAKFPQCLSPDPALARPEQYRKLPNGRWTNDRVAHLLGIPKGTSIPLVCLWEKFVSRSTPGAHRAFMDQAVLEQAKVAPRRRSYFSRSVIGDMSVQEHCYCSDRFNELIEKQVGPGNYPKGAGLHKESVWVGRLLADEADRNPSTIILEDGRTAYVQGGRKPAREVRLAIPLKFYVARWRREFASKHGLAYAKVTQESDPIPCRPEEVQFRQDATSIEAARGALSRIICQFVRLHPRVLVQSAEGLGKTTALMKALPEIMPELDQIALAGLSADNQRGIKAELSRPSAFGFTSYDLAEEKAAEFNRLNRESRFRGIVMPSFTRMYEDACRLVGEVPVASPSWAAMQGHDNLATAIQSIQPGVWVIMQRQHSDVFRSGGSWGMRRNVYFVPHQTLHQASTSPLAGAFLHPSFFSVEPNEWWRFAEEMRFRVVVHDEVPTEALVAMHRAPEVEWCMGLFEKHPDVWVGGHGRLSEKYGTFNNYQRSRGALVTFESVLEIHRAGYDQSDSRVVAPYEKYGGDGPLYKETHGALWYARRRAWWHNLADRTALLTTERLPTEVIRGHKSDSGEAEFEVLTLQSSGLRSGQISVHVRPRCQSEDAEQIRDDLRDLAGDPSMFVVSNKLGGSDQTASHKAVLGSNDLVGQSVGQIVFHKPPEEYERLQILNHLSGLAAAIRLSHVDQINQTAGRNLGFRQVSDRGVKHHLAIGLSLWAGLDQTLYDECRYDLQIVEDAELRRKRNYVTRRNRQIELARDEEDIADLVAEYDLEDSAAG